MVSACPYSGGYPTGYGMYAKNTEGVPPRLYDRVQASGFTHFQQSGTGAIRKYYNYFRVTPMIEPLDALDTLWTMQDEAAEPGYYAATLDSGIGCELTVGPKSAVHRYTFPATPTARLVVDFSLGGLAISHGRTVPMRAQLRAVAPGVVQGEIVVEGVPLAVHIECDAAALAPDALVRPAADGRRQPPRVRLDPPHDAATLRARSSSGRPSRARRSSSGWGSPCGASPRPRRTSTRTAAPSPRRSIGAGRRPTLEWRDLLDQIVIEGATRTAGRSSPPASTTRSSNPASPMTRARSGRRHAGSSSTSPRCGTSTRRNSRCSPPSPPTVPSNSSPPSCPSTRRRATSRSAIGWPAVPTVSSARPVHLPTRSSPMSARSNCPASTGTTHWSACTTTSVVSTARTTWRRESCTRSPTPSTWPTATTAPPASPATSATTCWPTSSMRSPARWTMAFDPATGLLIDSEFYEGGRWNYSFRLSTTWPPESSWPAGRRRSSRCSTVSSATASRR